MPDREKVSKGLEHCFHGQECCGDIECPYYIEHLSDCCCLEECQENLKADAIAMLKEQEADMIALKNAYKELAEKGSVIVRCKDCKWWDKKDGANYGYCHACKHGYSSDHWEIGIYRTYKGDWFCADGEPKEGREV